MKPTEQTQRAASYSEKKVSTPEVTQDYSDDGVDLTLIRWMLSLSPEHRLQVLQDAVRSVMSLRNGRSFT